MESSAVQSSTTLSSSAWSSMNFFKVKATANCCTRGHNAECCALFYVGTCFAAWLLTPAVPHIGFFNLTIGRPHQALRLHRVCSLHTNYLHHVEELKGYLVKTGYDEESVQQRIDKATRVDRDSL